MTTKEIFSQNLTWMLNAKEISQNKLAKAIGVTQQTVNDYCNGKAVPSITTLTKICEVLDLRADFLLGFSDNNYPAIVRWINGLPVFRDLEFNTHGITQNKKYLDINDLLIELLDIMNKRSRGGGAN